MSAEDKDEDVFEITDFTNASPWESFISSIEEILHQWGLTASTYSPESGYYPQHRKSEKVSYVGHKFVVTLHVTGEKRRPIPKQSDQDWPDAMVYMMDQSSDFPTVAHPVSRWYGIDQFILIAPDEKSEAITTEAQIRLLLSSVSLAITNTGCTIPMFIQIHKNWRHMYMGQCEGCGLRTVFEMVHLKNVPPHFDHLSGLIDLFRSKLCGSPAKPPSVTIAARLSYILRHWNIDDWPVAPLADNQGSSLTKDCLGSLPVGATIDPVQELCLSAVWSCLTEETVIDNATSSGFDPFNAPVWSITTQLSDNPGLLLNERLNSFLKTCYRTDTFPSLLGNKLLQEDIYNPAVGGSDFSHALTKLTSPASISSLSSVVYSTSRRLEFGSEFEQISESEQDTVLEYLFPDSVPHSDQPLKEKLIEDELTRQLKSAPPNSLTARLARTFCLIHNSKGLKAVAHIWYEMIQELRYRWENGITIEGVGDELPDMFCCLLHQKLQMLNNCIMHKISHTEKLHSNPSSVSKPATAAKESLEEFHSPTSSLSFSQRVHRQASREIIAGSVRSDNSSDDEFYEAQEVIEPSTPVHDSPDNSSGQLVKTESDNSRDSPSVTPRKLDLEPVVNVDPLSLFACEADTSVHKEVRYEEVGRVGALEPFKDLTLLATGDKLYVPETQEPTPFTEDMLWEQQSVLSKLGTTEEAAQVRAKMQSMSLISDMQAFKAANPGCQLEDFIRWYSPRDWIDGEEETEELERSGDGWELDDETETKGHLSIRMRQPGNMWAESWESATPVPAYKQKRLFDDTKEAEKVLHFLSALKPFELVLMLLPCLVHSAVLTLRKRLENMSLSTAWGYLDDAVSIARTVQRVTLNSLPIYQECIGLLEKAEHNIAVATSLKMKLKQGIDVNGQTKKLSSVGDKELETSVQILIEQPELVLQDPMTSVTGLSFQGLLQAQMAIENIEESLNTRITAKAVSLKPTAREFILRTVSSQPSQFSTASPQRMFCLLTKNEIRLAGAFTQDILLT